MRIDWILTDERDQQYGRQISDSIFEFKEPAINDGKPVEIILSNYTEEQIEDCINSYGYTMSEDRGLIRNIKELYGEDTNWIIAECLFEMQQ